MADSHLNHSWPSFSKLWMKRWSFKRASDCKPCSHEFSSVPGTGCVSPESMSPPSIAEDVFFGMTEEKDDSSGDTDSEDHTLDLNSSIEDLLSLNPSLQGTEYFKDLEIHLTGGTNAMQEMTTSVNSCPCNKPQKNNGRYFQHDNGSNSCPGSLSYQESSKGTREPLQTTDTQDLCAHADRQGDGSLVNTVKYLGDLDDKVDKDTEPETFPILLRTLSSSRRHSWEYPVSPVDPGKRFSLDASTMDSDGEQGDADPSQLTESFTLPEGGPAGPINTAEEKDPPQESPNPKPKDGSDLEDASKRLRSKSVVHLSEKVGTVRLSRSLEDWFPAPEGTEQKAREESETTPEEQNRMLMVTQVLQELKHYHGAKQRQKTEGKASSSQNLTWYEFLSNANEEEDKTDKVEKGTKVKRRLSSLRSRVAGSFQKDKGKNREKEQQKEKEKEREKEKEKEPKEKMRMRNGHQLVPGTFSSCTTCTLCSKTLQRKPGLQCMNCGVNVHKSCKNLLGECSSSSSKLKRDSLRNPTPGSPQSTGHNHSQAGSFLKEQSRSAVSGPDGSCASSRSLGMTITQRGSNTQLTTSTPANHANTYGSITGEMEEIDGFIKLKQQSEDAVSLAPSTAESIVVEDAQYASLRGELELDAQDIEAESWSLAVDPAYLKKHPKEAVKRQDVIHELIQTEMHHVRTLKIMLNVYVRGIRENLQMDDSKVEKIFPCVENLLEIHRRFLSRLKERRKESLEEGSDHNYVIHRIGDILVSEFSGEIGERMKESYGDFCSHHSEAVNYYKELLQNNKKFQNLIRKINNLSIVRRLGVPECILLVTQRITKYPVLVERIIQNTEVGSEDHEELTRALGLIKDAITQVDAKVNDYENKTRLKDIASKMEPKSSGKFKDGRLFGKEEILKGRRRLLHEGMVYWKAASGRLKDILAVLLTDVLLLIQEKDQKYTFATVDSKPSVISLQKLIVREVAHEEKAMFLICASSAEPEMYEIHTTSKEERNTWMNLIRQAAESCPDVEEGVSSDPEEERRLAEARALKLKEFQERLISKDRQIVQSLSEKLQIFTEISEVMSGFEDSTQGARSRLLVRGDPSDTLLGEQLLKDAIAEVENLQNLLISHGRDVSWQPEDGLGSSGLPRRAETFGGYESSPTVMNKNGSMKKKSYTVSYTGEHKLRERRGQLTSCDPELQDLWGDEGAQQMADEVPEKSWHNVWSPPFHESEFIQSVQTLSQLLYSLQAIIAQQDSYMELQRASLPDRDRQNRLRGNGLLEQEKQRNFEKQREEMANFQKLQSQLRLEQQRWERDREKQRRLAEVEEDRLKGREEECRQLQDRLRMEHEELEKQREKYQQDLERLRESTRTVEKEKERVEQQKYNLRKLKTMSFAPDTSQGHNRSHSISFNGDGFLNSEGALQLPVKPQGRSSQSVAGADYMQRPEVLLRRENSTAESRPLLPIKSEVPIHLISTTNQLHKQTGVQQRIPTKLALLSSKGKEKGSRGKGSHRTESAAADLRQLLPLRLSGKEDGTLKTKRSCSPNQNFQQEPVSPPDNHSDATHLSPHGVQKQNSQGSLQTPSPQPSIAEEMTKEDVIFF
ncbi:rho guanine nucleotide exchange factor 18-like isoform X1 [Acipenser ruthenus]|uniref:rho guanine nucleotide exchange factor 18-like isoform X1 n=2 Tax=Acipenser ruthenus TaxID=7906 RepID=UPI002740B315|nr:rho guanine nucleotide exchange factor 18-like isoform X1 [Acipenser ruthenus]